MITLTTEQAQQIEEALEDIVRVFEFETGTPVEALATIREALSEPVNTRRCSEYSEVEYSEHVKQELNWGANKFMPHEQPVSQVPVGKVLLHEGDVNAKGYLYNPLPEGTDLYAAPVQQVDLTDDEIAQAVGSPLDEVYLADFRAVIAADREKNK